MNVQQEKLEILLSRRRTITDELGSTFESTPKAHSADSGHAWGAVELLRYQQRSVGKVQDDEEVDLFVAEEAARAQSEPVDVFRERDRDETKESGSVSSSEEIVGRGVLGLSSGVVPWWGFALHSVRQGAKQKAIFATQTAAEVRSKLTEDARIFRRDVGRAVGHFRIRGRRARRSLSRRGPWRRASTPNATEEASRKESGARRPFWYSRDRAPLDSGLQCAKDHPLSGEGSEKELVAAAWWDFYRAEEGTALVHRRAASTDLVFREYKAECGIVDGAESLESPKSRRRALSMPLVPFSLKTDCSAATGGA
eukprot:CAMPEP_0194492688 /NCGR_PEP_ID=MMETSP0253-20130528/11158_1 /TAXON_ID=2966 /ORGANISM="Noctiluca scintillans" /LENGTH=310 /DNA_ID=CAMNT_0039333589 /DNA_START=62 /DNA_END=994 /DNA_ORIENTATION=-